MESLTNYNASMDMMDYYGGMPYNPQKTVEQKAEIEATELSKKMWCGTCGTYIKPEDSSGHDTHSDANPEPEKTK